MTEGAIVISMLFISAFGTIYFFLITRNRERIAMIQAGKDLKSLKSNDRFYMLFVMGMLALGVAVGVCFGYFLELLLKELFKEKLAKLPPEQFFMENNFEVAYAFTLFLFAGLSLLYSFKKIQKWNLKSKSE